ncbi:MAG: hypothetical protein FD161_2438 [Limisphaerales bacterium]|nr:MAG: hypothetical protein FD161_2438 [Limisphaerales bacterium]KAG0508655.1 MAG: hypothetical protein E1N63_2189 [Limisphaerales bacterium]TXT48728.1 MAG: hypothetical protein FD140_3514 [Limisphaerales bacterium]
MQLVYLDESGNSGNNLHDKQQPVFVLCALLVPEDKWLALETDLHDAVEKHFPSPRPTDFEVHATGLRNGDMFFRSAPILQRLELRDAWLRLAAKHQLKVIYRAIEKRKYHRWQQETFGVGVAINPHLVALPLVARVVDDYLAALPGQPHGMFISDEDRATMGDVEKAIQLLRVTPGALKLRRIVEKGFFADSRKSLPLQLCDLCAYQARKIEEARLGMPTKSVDSVGMQLLEPLIARGAEKLQDTLAWIVDQQKKGATRE